MDKKNQALRSNEEIARLASTPEISKYRHISTVKYQLEKAIVARQRKIMTHNRRVSERPLQTKREVGKSIGGAAIVGGIAGGLTGATVGALTKVLTLPIKQLRYAPIISVSMGAGAVLGAGALATLRAKKGRQRLSYIGYDPKLETLKYKREELKNPASPTYRYVAQQKTAEKKKKLGKAEKVFLTALSVGAVVGAVKVAPKVIFAVADEIMGVVKKVSPGHAKELLLFGKRAALKRRRKEPQLTGASFVPAVTATAIGATG